MASSRRDFLRAAAAISGGSLTIRAGTAVAGGVPVPATTEPGDVAGVRDQTQESSYRSKWGRWGPDDQKGAVNLITPAKRAAAAALVKTGRTVSRHRRVSHVTMERPVNAEELDAIAKAQGVAVGAGDALLVYCGREAYVQAAGRYGTVTEPRPGLHASCARFIRDRDVSVLGWDMLDARPDPEGLPFPAHRVLYEYGVPLLDNALLEPLAQACAEERRYEFMFMALPLKIPRGTGSPVNPIALF